MVTLNSRLESEDDLEWLASSPFCEFARSECGLVKSEVVENVGEPGLDFFISLSSAP